MRAAAHIFPRGTPDWFAEQLAVTNHPVIEQTRCRTEGSLSIDFAWSKSLRDLLLATSIVAGMRRCRSRGGLLDRSRNERSPGRRLALVGWYLMIAPVDAFSSSPKISCLRIFMIGLMGANE